MPAVPEADGADGADHGLARLLHLLAEEAPAAAFDRLAEAVAAGAGGADSDPVLLALARAGRIRSLLAERKRREKEMQGLVETARDLASLRDVDLVLDAIVHRTRQLLGTDATYLALVDERTGEAYMRITLGTVTRAIESVRLEPGRGVGGRIVVSGEPFATANYARDRALDHDPSVTDAVLEDGIVSIAGAPLRVGDDVVGVLFAANRHERAFEQSEVALLSSLADHASIVIENARLFARAEATAQELRAANAEVTRHSAALERASAAHEALMPMALRGADLAELVEAVAVMLDGAVAAVDVEARVLATAGPADLLDALPEPPHAADDAGRPGTAVPLDGPAGSDAWAAPVRAGPEAFGHLLLGRRSPVEGADLRILERAAQTAALLQLMERQVSAAEQRVRGELVDDLLAEREPDWTAFQRRAKRSGAIDFGVPHTVLVLSATGVTRRRLLRAAADHGAARGGLATEHAAHVVLVLPHVDARTAARTVPAHLERTTGGRVTAGAAGPATSAQAIRALHRDADRCHRLLLALGRTGRGASPDDLGVLGMVLDGTSRERVLALIDDALGPVLRYDAQHGALLVATLDAYFAAGQNPRAAARALQVHANTVYQRLDRVEQVLGHARWREPPDALSVQLALQLHRVLDEVPFEVLVRR